MKIGKTSFNPEAVKAMTFAEFEKTYKGVLVDLSLEEAYEKLTGTKIVPEKKDRIVSGSVKEKDKK